MVRRSFLLPLVAANENESVGRFVRARLLALGRLAPWRHRMTAARGAAFAAAMRMVHRVHRDAAVMGLAAEPAVATGLADRNVHVVRVGHRTDGAGVGIVNAAVYARIHQANHIVIKK